MWLNYQQAKVLLFSLSFCKRVRQKQVFFFYIFYSHFFHVRYSSSPLSLPYCHVTISVSTNGQHEGEDVFFFYILMRNYFVLMTETTDFMLEKTFSTLSDWGDTATFHSVYHGCMFQKISLPSEFMYIFSGFYIWAAGWQKGPYNKIWKFERDAYFTTSIYVESFLKIWNYTLLKRSSVSSLRMSFQNIMKHYDII